MSDSYITIVTVAKDSFGASVAVEAAPELGRKTIDWLKKEGVIAGDLTDCVLGGRGYRPGENFKKAIASGDSGFLELKINGVEMVAERRVFDSGENGLEEIRCPVCGGNNINSDWGDIIGAWQSGHDDKLRCEQCATESSITDYAFVPTWAFGDCALTFWNWPPLSSAFFNELKAFLKTGIKVVHGRR